MKKLTFVLFSFLVLQTSLTAQNESMKNTTSAYSFNTQYTTVNNTEIAYIKEGKGTKTLLFIHGLSSNLEAWQKNIKKLKKHFTCIAIDLPGYGKSEKNNSDATPTYYAKFLHDFIKQLNLTDVQ